MCELRVLADGRTVEERLKRVEGEQVAMRIEFVSQHHTVETRQHFDIIAEGLRDDIKKVAEAQVATNEKLEATNEKVDATNERIDRLDQKMDAGFANVRRDVAGLTRAFQGRRSARRR